MGLLVLFSLVQRRPKGGSESSLQLLAGHYLFLVVPDDREKSGRHKLQL